MSAGQGMRVALFITCVNDAVYPRTGQAMVNLLERLGHTVEVPPGQTCCGQMHSTPATGTRRSPWCAGSPGLRGLRRHRHPLRLLRGHGPRQLPPPRPGCRRPAAEVGQVAPQVYELTEFLVDVLGVTDVGAYFPHTVTYHPSCHGAAPAAASATGRAACWRAVKGLELRELPGAEECCGFGGTFALKNPDVSAAMGTDKVRNALATGAEVLCGADNSCLMHIGGILHRQDAPTRALHLAEILLSTEAEPHV